MGTTSKADTVEVQWPSGQVDKIASLAADQTVTVEEGKGVTTTKPYGKRTPRSAAPVKVAKN
jgi:hypothetical protein